MMQAMSGLSCIQGRLTETQKRMFDGADRFLCRNDGELQAMKVYTNIFHTVAKAGYGSPELRKKLELRFPEVLRRIVELKDDTSIGVICSSACRMPLSPSVLKSEVFPVLGSDKFKFDIKHLVNFLFYTAEPELFDEKLFDYLLAQVQQHKAEKSNIVTMIEDAKHRGEQLKGRSK